MFTGIVTETGKVGRITQANSGARLSIQAPRTVKGLKIGGSVAIDGVCLTAVRVGRTAFSVEVVPETLRKTSLAGMEAGRKVNLERPLRASSELGGHFVQGHVDACCRVLGHRKAGKETLLDVELPESLRRLVVEKGSIAVNGVSLTVAGLREGGLRIALIPHTLKETNLGMLCRGDRVNIEVDILGKYVASLLPASPTRKRSRK